MPTASGRYDHGRSARARPHRAREAPAHTATSPQIPHLPTVATSASHAPASVSVPHPHRRKIELRPRSPIHTDPRNRRKDVSGDGSTNEVRHRPEQTGDHSTGRRSRSNATRITRNTPRVHCYKCAVSPGCDERSFWSFDRQGCSALPPARESRTRCEVSSRSGWGSSRIGTHLDDAQGVRGVRLCLFQVPGCGNGERVEGLGDSPALRRRASGNFTGVQAPNCHRLRPETAASLDPSRCPGQSPGIGQGETSPHESQMPGDHPSRRRLPGRGV